MCGCYRDELLERCGIGWAMPYASHIQQCPDCGGDLHIKSASTECMVCGRWATHDEQHVVYRAPRRGHLPTNGIYDR